MVLSAGGIYVPHNHSPKDLHDLAKPLDIDIRAPSDMYISNLADLLSMQLGVFKVFTLPHLFHWALLGVQQTIWTPLGLHWDWYISQLLPNC